LARDAANDRSKKAALVKLHTKVIERWFLLCLKAKYAGKCFFLLVKDAISKDQDNKGFFVCGIKRKKIT